MALPTVGSTAPPVRMATPRATSRPRRATADPYGAARPSWTSPAPNPGGSGYRPGRSHRGPGQGPRGVSAASVLHDHGGRGADGPELSAGQYGGTEDVRHGLEVSSRGHARRGRAGARGCRRGGRRRPGVPGVPGGARGRRTGARRAGRAGAGRRRSRLAGGSARGGRTRVVDPECSRATTAPKTTVAPVAASRAPLVSVRTRALAASACLRPTGVRFFFMGGIARFPVCGDRTIPSGSIRWPRRTGCGPAETCCRVGCRGFPILGRQDARPIPSDHT